MKKVFFLLAMISAAIAAQAQAQAYDSLCTQVQTFDTLWCGDREPTFYYWGDNWFDSWAFQTGGCYGRGRVRNSGSGPEFARYCYTKSPLRVIGIAGVVYFEEHKPYDDHELIWLPPIDMTEAYKNMDKEYFRLYETDSNGGMELLAEKSWNDVIPRYVMEAAYMYGLPCKGAMAPVREVYFDSARTVCDSFYVSATSNNDRTHYESPFVTTHLGTIEWGLGKPYENDTVVVPGPNPRHFKRKLHGFDKNDVCHHVNDTNWHTFVKEVDGIISNDTIPYSEIPYFNSFMLIFPIIDTSRYTMPEVVDSCQVPTGFSCIYSRDGTAVFAWDFSETSGWDLCIAPQGSTPEQGSLTHCTSNVATITGLDTSLCYTAWVRTRCQNNVRSHWSDSVDFCMNGGTAAVPSVVDSHTFLFPNPASDQVQVASSFRISTVEVYSLSGQLVSRVKADGISATLDTRSLPSATYLVRIATNHGTTVKKLVVE